jgi:transposase-like protein
VLAGLRGDRSVKDVCREHEISDTLYYSWRDKLLGGGREALAGKDERNGEKELRRKIRELERALGRKTYELEIAGEAFAGLGLRQRVARSRRLLAACRKLAVVARVMQMSRQAIYRTLKSRKRAAGHAGRRPAPAPPLLGPSPPTGLLPGRATRPALAHGHDLGLGRRPRLVLSERHRRLLHPRDPGLGARPAFHRPHSGLDHRTPREVRETWEDAQESEASTKSRGLG